MSGLSEGSEYSDVLTNGYLTINATVTTTQSEAKVGASPLAGRETLIIHNKGSSTIYVGPTGVTSTTGLPVEKSQSLMLNVGTLVSVFMITASGSSTVIIQELS